MKKVLFYIITTILLTSCGDQLRLEQLTMGEDVSYGTEIQYILSGSIAQVGRFYQENGTLYAEQHVSTVQYGQQLNGTLSNNYESFKNPPQDWAGEYGILRLIDAGSLESTNKKRPAYGAAFKVLNVFMFSYITDHFGDIPFSEALKGRDGIKFPKFDTQRDIYDGLLTRLDEAVTTLSATNDVIEPKFDLLFTGSKDKWIRFANSLKLRLLVRSYDAYKKAGVDNGAKIQQLVSSGLLMRDNSESASFAYEGKTAVNSWVGGPLRLTGGDRDFVMRKPSKTLVEVLKNLNDPRLKTWIAPARSPLATVDEAEVVVTDLYGFTYLVDPVAVSSIPSGAVMDYPIGSYYAGTPVGMMVGIPNIYGNTETFGGFDNLRISNFGNVFKQNSHEVLKAVLMNADEVQFCLAEASKRGWISGNAELFYKNGIKLNLQRWAIPEVMIDSYLGEPKIQLGLNNDLEMIATQKWLALFQVACETYSDYRRTRLPSIIASSMPASALLSYPVRFRYPTNEVANNTEQVNKAIERLGEDTQDAKMWLLK